MNITVFLPPGTTDHGSPGLICVPPQWTDFIVFFATNYFAHAATVVGRPGQSTVETATGIVSALFAPGSGALRTLRYFIVRPVAIRGDELQRAAAAGALCMVVRVGKNGQSGGNGNIGEGRARDEEEGGIELQQQQQQPAAIDDNRSDNQGEAIVELISDKVERVSGGAAAPPARSGSGPSPQSEGGWFARIFTGSRRLITPYRKFHGGAVLPPGDDFQLFECPVGTPLKPHGATAPCAVGGISPQEFHIGVSYSVPKILIGLFQATYAVVTLYRTKGNQLELYGYAAFGLSVVPYAFMSILNTLANLLVPEYPTMFLVHTPDMDKAREAGGKFGDVIAAVDIEAEIDAEKKIELDAGGISGDTAWLTFLLGLLCITTPIAIVGAVSKFRPGTMSTSADRGWLISWLVVGSVSSLWIRGFNLSLEVMSLGTFGSVLLFFAIDGALFIPAIGGMVTVGKMLQWYGICTEIGS